MIKFKTERCEDEFNSWDKCHPRLRALVVELDRMLEYFKDNFNNEQIWITCVYRSPEENERIYGRPKNSAHSDNPSRAVDIAVHTAGHPYALSEKAVTSIEAFVEKWWHRNDGYKAFIHHGESGRSEHLHLSVQR